jgi:hypothetical protein
MPGDRLKIPDLILIQSISFALFVIDGNGPAVTADARDAMSLPVQSSGEKERGRIRQVGLSVVDDSSLLPKVMDTMGVAIAVIGLLGAFVGHRDFSKDGLMSLGEGLMMLWV